MLFPTLTFGLFFLAVYAVVWGVARENEWRKILLLLASWVFYGAWDWRFVALLIVSAFSTGAPPPRSPRATEEPTGGARRWSTLGVVANLAILGFFKYFDFFLEQLGVVLHGVGFERDLPLLSIILPVGVSFFTFQGMSYLVDVYRRRVPRGRRCSTSRC